MANPFILILFVVLSIILIIPFGIAFIYFCLSIWQLVTGAKEHSRFRQKGGIIALVISAIAIVTIVILWLEMWFS